VSSENFSAGNSLADSHTKYTSTRTYSGHYTSESLEVRGYTAGSQAGM